MAMFLSEFHSLVRFLQTPEIAHTFLVLLSMVIIVLAFDYNLFKQQLEKALADAAQSPFNLSSSLSGYDYAVYLTSGEPAIRKRLTDDFIDPPSHVYPSHQASEADDVGTVALGSESQYDLLSPSGYKYEVFLSFHRSDASKRFTNCLYQALEGAGFRTFLGGDEDLQTGTEITFNLSQARIAESKIFIPILSRNYASSKWCLDELTFMLECKKRRKHMILPIFYDLTLIEVLYLYKNYGIALQKHEDYAMIVNQWKEPQAEVGLLKGLDLTKLVNDGNEGKWIGLSVSEVVSELKKAQLIENENFDDHVEAVKLPNPNIAAVEAEVNLGAQEVGSSLPSGYEYGVFSSFMGYDIPKGFTGNLDHALHEDAGVCMFKDEEVGSSLPSGYDYGVFLSFMGYDIPKGFTGNLDHALHEHAGVRMFKDEEIRIGEGTGSNLLKAVSKSLISIPIFSKNYASSKWCLNELTCMLECNKEGNNIILPVFYDVSPSEVRNQTGNYGRALKEHAQKYNMKIVQQWREALSEVGRLKGMHLDKMTNGLDEQLIKLIVSKVVRELEKASRLSIPKDLLGIEDQVKDVNKLLRLGESDVRIIGIVGMSGIGKTTLAKVIYDQIREDFDSCSFTEGIREISGSEDLSYLQSSLVANLSKLPSFTDVGEGIMRELKHVYCGRKLLIVLDDVDDTKELDALLIRHDSFDSGSRIMITTRNRDVLERVDSIYEVTLMNQDAALKLFCKHAFGEDTPVDELCDLSRDIVSKIGGLPLALQLAGSSLYGRSEINIWKATLDELRKGSSGVIQDTLRKNIFESFDLEEKQIFLDIACFFVGEDISNVSPIWKDNFPGIRNDVLVSKSIIKIGDDHKIWMYDQLRDLGRELVRQENDNQPGMRSRLWLSEDAKDVIEKCMGTSNIEGIRIHLDALNEEQCYLTSEHFRNLSGLRFLDLDHHVHLVGDFENLLPSLQWLRWPNYPFNSLVNLPMLNLVSLELERNDLRDDWASSIKMMKLKALNLRSSRNLKTTPDFSVFPHLERLNLSHCSQLKVIDSIAELNNLSFLDISFCSSIEELPGNFGCLEKLEIFNARECKNLARIPDSIGQLSSLKDLSLDGTCISMLPASVKCLLRLQCLSLRGCSALTVLPDLHGCELLEHVPGLLGSKQSSLITLDISGCTRIQSVPSLSNLNVLKTLDANGCTKLEELEGLDRLNALESLDISNCHSIRTLPNLSNLHILKNLHISGCRQLNELLGLVQPRALRELDISSCPEIEMMPDLSKFEQLEALYAHDCGNLQELMGLDELKALKILRVSECKEIEYLPDVSKLKQLKELCIDGCQKLQDLIGLDRLESLEILRISHCKEIIELPDLSMLKQLKELDATGCSALQKLEGLDQLNMLKKLHISCCKEIRELADISKLKHLEELSADGCEQLQGIVGLHELKALKIISVSKCKEIRQLPDLSKLNRLQELYASDCVNLQQLPGLGGLKELRNLDVSGSEKLEGWLQMIDPEELLGVPFFKQKTEDELTPSSINNH